MLIKLLANVFCGLFVVVGAYSLFYFRLFPRLIVHYRKVVRAGRKYDREIAEIHRKPEGDGGK